MKLHADPIDSTQKSEKVRITPIVDFVLNS